MPRKPTPEVPTPTKFASLKQIDLAIQKLSRRLDEVTKLDATVHRYDGPERELAQSNIRTTILEVFGSSSPEYLEHRYHKIEEGPIYINGGEALWQSNFQNGIPMSTAMLRGLIARLEEKKLDFEHEAERAEAKTDARPNRVFIGHGHAPEWLKLKNFLVDRLGASLHAHGTSNGLDLQPEGTTGFAGYGTTPRGADSGFAGSWDHRFAG